MPVDVRVISVNKKVTTTTKKVLTHNTSSVKGLTNPIPRGSAAALLNPISFDVNIDVVGPRANSCPEKCTAMHKDMCITALIFGDRRIFIFSLCRSVIIVRSVFEGFVFVFAFVVASGGDSDDDDDDGGGCGGGCSKLSFSLRFSDISSSP